MQPSGERAKSPLSFRPQSEKADTPPIDLARSREPEPLAALVQAEDFASLSKLLDETDTTAKASLVYGFGSGSKLAGRHGRKDSSKNA